MRFAKLALAVPVLLGVTASAAHAGLTITPTFGASITGNANSAAIQATINSAISVYQNRFINPINVNITFENMSSGLGQSSFNLYSDTYSNYRNALIADKAAGGDSTAFLAFLPSSGNPVPGQSTSSVETTFAGARALGLVGASTGPDGTISLNTSLTNISRTGTQNFSKYDLKTVTMHEIDEILGVNSDLDNGFPGGYVGPLDFFRYNGTGSRSFTTSSSEASYFSVDGGATHLVNFNQGSSGDRHDWASSGTPRVQDAFGTPGSAPDLAAAELTALDVVGYNTAAVPEASSAAGFGLLLSLGGLGLVARKRSAEGRSL